MTGHDSGRLRLWNADTGSTINFLEHRNAVSCLAVAHNRKGDESVLSGSLDGRVGVWDVLRRKASRPQLLSMFEAHPRAEVLCVLFDASREAIVTGGTDRMLRVWGAVAHELQAEIAAHSDAVTCLALDGNFLFSGSEDNSVAMWDVVAACAKWREAVFAKVCYLYQLFCALLSWLVSVSAFKLKSYTE